MSNWDYVQSLLDIIDKQAELLEMNGIFAEGYEQP